MYLYKILAIKLCIAIYLITILSSCQRKQIDTLRNQDIFSVLQGDSILLMDGTINSKSLKAFNNLYQAFPSIKKINIKNCDGSMDDATNLKLSKQVHELKFNTHLSDNGHIASGGVDFFLAGIERSRGNNIAVGVHSWADGDNHQATDFPRGHANHLPYINYYIAVGMRQQEAENFYYFTIYAAPAASIHYMTEAELQTYSIFTK